MTATKVKFDKNNHQYESPRQELYALNVSILHDEKMGKHLLVSQSHPEFDKLETMVFLADEAGNILSYSELDMSHGHVDHDEMIKRSPHQLIDWNVSRKRKTKTTDRKHCDSQHTAVSGLFGFRGSYSSARAIIWK